MFIQLNHLILKILLNLIFFILFGFSLFAQNSQDKLNEAQIKNQEAQSNYYNKQAENSGSLLIAYSAPITTIVGILIAVLTISLQNRNTRRLEEIKWDKTRKDEMEKWNRTKDDELEKWKRIKNDEANIESMREVRLAAADLIKKVAIAAQSMTWVLWIAQNDTNNFSPDFISEHDEKMKHIYAELAASQAFLASLDKDLYIKTKPLVTDIYSLDHKLAERAKIIYGLKKSGNTENYHAKVKDLGALWLQVYQFSKGIPDRFADMLDMQTDRET